MTEQLNWTESLYSSAYLLCLSVTSSDFPWLYYLKECASPAPLTLSSPKFIFLHSTKAPDISSRFVYKMRACSHFWIPSCQEQGLTGHGHSQTRITIPVTNTSALSSPPAFAPTDPHAAPLLPPAGGWPPSAASPRPHPRSRTPWSLSSTSGGCSKNHTRAGRWVSEKDSWLIL